MIERKQTYASPSRWGRYYVVYPDGSETTLMQYHEAAGLAGAHKGKVKEDMSAQTQRGPIFSIPVMLFNRIHARLRRR
jgi:hypothetical protein